jgi:hypothetical protein
MQVDHIGAAPQRQTCLDSARDLAHEARKVTETAFGIFLGFTVLALGMTAIVGFFSMFDGKPGVPPAGITIALTGVVFKSLFFVMLRVSMVAALLTIVSGFPLGVCYLTEAALCRLTGREITPVTLHH